MVVATQQRIAFIPRAKEDPRPDLYRCHLTWSEGRTLLVGWADTVTVVSLTEGKEGSTAAHVTDVFKVDCTIGGIGFHRSDFVLLAHNTSSAAPLSKPEDPRRRSIASRPELRIISKSGEELSSDALDLSGYERYRSDDYRLSPRPGQAAFLVLSPRDLVLASLRDASDHIDWLIDHARFDEAIDAVRKAPSGSPSTRTATEIGRLLLQHLADHGQQRFR